MITKKMAIDITADLDKRPIAKLVQEASKFSSSVFFEYKDKKVNAKSSTSTRMTIEVAAAIYG